MAHHRLPRPACGDAHRLVVVARRPARCERVAEPESVVGRDAVREIGERRGALVGGDHQIAVVAVVAHDIGRWHGLLAVGVRDQVVGQVEKATDQRAVTRDDLGLLRLPIGQVGRRPLHHEAALGADRHDHRVLHCLRLRQPEHLGAEVLAPIGVSDATARDRTEPQMHALDARRIRRRSRTTAAARAGRPPRASRASTRGSPSASHPALGCQ